MEDFSGLSFGCRIFTGTDDFSGSALTNPTVPLEFRNVTRSFVMIKKHAVLGASVVVLPGVTIGEGAAIGACSFVTKDVKPWTINVGIPTREIRKRPKEKILEMEKELYKKYHGSLARAIETRGRAINIAFRWWGRNYLYNEEDLRIQLVNAGFKKIVRCEWNKSNHIELCDLETRKDSKLIVEAEK